jgi:hypothetical protein
MGIEWHDFIPEDYLWRFASGKIAFVESVAEVMLRIGGTDLRS